jgi:Helix-turn-helix domain
MAHVLKLKVGDPTAKTILLCLANYCREDGDNAFPSVARLKRDTELGESTIRSKLVWLEEKGFIKRGDQEMAAIWAKRADRVPICYDLVIRGPAAGPRESTGSSSEQRGVQQVAPRGPAAGPNPSSYPPTNKSVTQTLRDREKPPEGREPTWEDEFSKRFGVRPS